MAKHGTGSGHGKRHEPPPKVTHRPHHKPPPTAIPPAPAPPPALAEHRVILGLATAAHRVLNAASQVAGHSEHAAGCPFGGGGPCTCGYLELKAALEELKTALEP